MAMGYGIAPLKNDWDGQMRFSVMSLDHKTGTKGQMIFGTEPDQEGFTEPELRKFLADEIGLTSSDIEDAVQGAKKKAAEVKP